VEKKGERKNPGREKEKIGERKKTQKKKGEKRRK